MTYLYKVVKTKDKPCLCPELPSIAFENLDAGTVWECDTCKKRWKVVYETSAFPSEELVWKDISGKLLR